MQYGHSGSFSDAPNVVETANDMVFPGPEKCLVLEYHAYCHHCPQFRTSK